MFVPVRISLCVCVYYVCLCLFVCVMLCLFVCALRARALQCTKRLQRLLLLLRRKLLVAIAGCWLLLLLVAGVDNAPRLTLRVRRDIRDFASASVMHLPT